MTTLTDLISLKTSSVPIGFSGTPVILPIDKALFPYPNHWRGDYRRTYPIIESRQAGFRPRMTYEYEYPKDVRFGLADGCFETAPSTQFPCWEIGYGCNIPKCKIDCNPERSCISRYNFR
jgi:hypothetical protein